MNRLILVCLVCVFFLDCTNKRDQYNNLIKTIEFEKVSKNFLLSDLADSVSIVALDSREVVGEISELIFSQDHIVILDRYKAKKIFIFDNRGNLQTTISALGGGPKEFLWPRTILFTDNNEALIIHCDRTKKILKFSLSGDFIKEWGVSSLGQLEDIVAVNNGYVIAMKPDSYVGDKLLVVDNDFNKIGEKSLLEYYENPPFVGGGKINFFYSKLTGDGYYYKNLLSNFLVEMKNDQLKNVFYINLPDEFEVDFNFTNRNLVEVIDESKKEGKLYLSDNFVDMGDYMFLSLINSGNSTLAIWEKSTNKAFFIDKISNDISTLVNLNGVWGSYNNNPGILITAIEAPIMVQLLESVEIVNPNFKDKFSELSFSSEDNPILIIYHFKSKIEFEKK